MQIDFGPLLSNPKLMIFGAAAQFGIFFTLAKGMLGIFIVTIIIIVGIYIMNALTKSRSDKKSDEV